MFDLTKERYFRDSRSLFDDSDFNKFIQVVILNVKFSDL